MKNKTIPDLYLEQALLDELPDEKRELVDNEESVRRLKELEESNRRILEMYDPGEMAAKIIEGLDDDFDEEPREGRVIKGFFLQHRAGVLLAAAAVALIAGVSPFLFRQQPAVAPSVPGTEITRIKGLEPELSVYRKQEGTVEQLDRGSVARERDLLQISYNAAGKPFGTIFSIDGRGVVTLHYPSDTGGSLVLKRDGEVPLESAYQLDDAPFFERFFFVASDSTFSISTVLSAADVMAKQLISGTDPEAGKLTLPDGFYQTSLTILKEVSK